MLRCGGRIASPLPNLGEEPGVRANKGMKNQKQNQNNPVVIGALLVVLAGAMVVIFRSFVPQNEPTFTPAPPKSADAAPASAAAPESPLERDPFFHSDIRRIAAEGEKLTAPKSGAAGEGDGAFAPSGPFDSPLAPNGNPPANPAGKNKAKSGPKTHLPPAAKTPTPPDPAIAENAQAQSLRLTAVLGGTQPRAILESAGNSPVVVTVGDEIGILRVAAIRAREIVLSGKSGLWTIPLQSAAPAETGAAPSEPTVADDAKPAETGSKERNNETGK